MAKHTFGARPDSGFETPFDTPLTIPISELLKNDRAGGGELIFFDAREPENGTVEWVGDSIIFTPDSGYSGAAEFIYYIANGEGAIDAATVSLNVLERPSPPDNLVLIGSASGDRLRGDAGDDLLRGEGGNDRLIGGAGEDVIIGGDGNDKLYGDTPWDADSAADIFVFDAADGSDKVYDFEVGLDRVELAGSADFAFHYGPAGQTVVKYGETRIVFYDALLTLADFDLTG